MLSRVQGFEQQKYFLRGNLILRGCERKCKVLSQGIPRLNKIQLNESCLV